MKQVSRDAASTNECLGRSRPRYIPATSNWKSVLSGAQQGSLLCPMLFLIYINNLEDYISSKVLKFADDTTLFRKVTNVTDKQSLQDDLDKLVKF